MRPISLRTRPLARKPLVPASSAFRPRTRNLAVQSPRPPGPLPAPRPRPYATAPNTQAPAPSPGEVSSSAKAQRKAGTLPAGYKAAERRVLAAMVALPILLVTSYVLYQRLILGQERKKLKPPLKVQEGTGGGG